MTVAGSPDDILLYAFGREGYARVHLNGDSAAVEALETTKFVAHAVTWSKISLGPATG